MEQRYTSLALSLVFATSAMAVSVNVKDHHGNVVNGTTQYVYCDMDAGAASIDFTSLNISGIDKYVDMKRYELNVIAGTQNYYCWNVCFLPEDAGAQPLWVADDPVYLQNNVAYTGFHAYYDPMGHAGTSSFRYVWFTTADHDDSTWVDIVFTATPTGIHENSGLVRAFSAFPNPSVNGAVTLDYELASAQTARLVVYNTLGERAITRTLANTQGRVVLGTGELVAGVWFASIEQNGRAIATRRLVIVR